MIVLLDGFGGGWCGSLGVRTRHTRSRLATNKQQANNCPAGADMAGCVVGRSMDAHAFLTLPLSRYEPTKPPPRRGRVMIQKMVKAAPPAFAASVTIWFVP